MARSNGHNGQAGPPVHPQEGVPHWRHPNDPGQGPAPAPQHGFAQPPFQAHPGQAHPGGFAPSPDLPPFGQQSHDPYAQGQPLAHYAPYPAAQPVQPLQAHQWGAPLPADPHGYDLGQFGHGQPHSGQPHSIQPQPLSHDPFPRTAPPQSAHSQQWSQHQYPAPPAHQDSHLPPPHAFAEPVTGQRAALPFPQAAPMRADMRGAQVQQPAAQQAEDGYDDEDYEEEFEEEPKRGRKLMVVGALVGAICVGGGLAYAYKTFSGGKTPLINAQKAPSKAAPAPVQAPKVAAKLPEAVPVQVAAVAAPADDGVRRVQSIVIPPPGGAAVAPPQPTPPPTAAVMPGMVLDNMPRVPAPAAAPPPASAPLRPSTAPAQAASQPAVALPVAKPPQAIQQRVAAATPPAPERKAVAVPKKSPDAFNPATAGAAGGVAAVASATPPPAAPKSALGAGGAGYVATVLSTQRGRPEAMKAFADLQQKFPDVLGGKPAEVQEKDLGAEKGVWYRAVVGPPGSREAASSVCTQLKASGYGQCFVTAY